MSSSFNDLYTYSRLKGMIGGKDYQCWDMVFPLVAVTIDFGTGFLQDGPMTVVHKIYLENVLKRMKDQDNKYTSSDKMLNEPADISRLKMLINSTFEEHFETELL